MRYGVLAVLMVVCLVTGGYCGGIDTKTREKVSNAALSTLKREYLEGNDFKIIMCEKGKLSEEGINRYNHKNVYCVICQYKHKRIISRACLIMEDQTGELSVITSAYLMSLPGMRLFDELERPAQIPNKGLRMLQSLWNAACPGELFIGKRREGEFIKHSQKQYQHTR